jgi:hypothetical protein
MNDLKVKMAPRIKAESGKQKVEMETQSTVGGEGKAPPCTHSACGGECAETMRMAEIDVRELSDEMLIFMLQLMAPEKYGQAAPCGEDAQQRAEEQRAEEQRAEIRGQRSETIPESGCEFVLHGADGEGLMRTECPEMGEEGLMAEG